MRRAFTSKLAVFLLWPAALAAQQPPADRCDSAQSETLAASARQSLAQKKYDAAAADFRRALDACPEQRSLQLELAQTLGLQRNFDQARRAAGDFLAAQPGSEAGLLVLANIELMSQQFAECLRLADQVLAHNDESVAALQLKANAQYLAGRESAAVETLRAAIALSPSDEEAVYSLGRIYYQQNRFGQAIAQFRRVLEINPQSYKAYDNLGLCYEALAKDEEAIHCYLQALNLVYQDHRDYDWPYANLANLLLKRGENDKAFQLAAEAAKRNPASARNFFLTGKALVRLEKPEMSVKWLKRSIELDPNYPEPHYLLGQVYQKLGQKENAQREFQTFQAISAKIPRSRR